MGYADIADLMLNMLIMKMYLSILSFKWYRYKDTLHFTMKLCLKNGEENKLKKMTITWLYVMVVIMVCSIDKIAIQS